MFYNFAKIQSLYLKLLLSKRVHNFYSLKQFGCLQERDDRLAEVKKFQTF